MLKLAAPAALAVIVGMAAPAMAQTRPAAPKQLAPVQTTFGQTKNSPGIAGTAKPGAIAKPSILGTSTGGRLIGNDGSTYRR